MLRELMWKNAGTFCVQIAFFFALFVLVFHFDEGRLNQVACKCFFFLLIFRKDNVTFVNISACKTAWPNAQKCVKIDFSIRLRSLPNATTNGENQTDTPATEAVDKNEFEMNREELVTMWVRFGRKEFSDNGFNVYIFLIDSDFR